MILSPEDEERRREMTAAVTRILADGTPEECQALIVLMETVEAFGHALAAAELAAVQPAGNA
jgi:hypothetical protein